MKLTAGLIGGFFTAFAGSVLAIILFATTTRNVYFWSGVSLLVVWSLAIIFCQRAPSVRNAWSQMFGALGFMLLAIPFALFQKMNPGLENAAPDLVDSHLIELLLLFGMLGTLFVGGAIVCALISWRLGKEPKK